MRQPLRVLAISAGCLSIFGATPAVASAEPGVAIVLFPPQERAVVTVLDSPANDAGLPGQWPRPHWAISQVWQGNPVKTVGRLFFVHGDNGEDSYCTATSIRSGNRDVVLTAGHCVWKPGAPDLSYLSMVFAPAYHKGAADPKGAHHRFSNDMQRSRWTR